MNKLGVTITFNFVIDCFGFDEKFTFFDSITHKIFRSYVSKFTLTMGVPHGITMI